MPWEIEYDASADETTIRWIGDSNTVSETIPGEVTELYNGYLTGDARDAIREMIQSAGTPERIAMQFNLNYGIDNVTPIDR
jgi:hypothetical protein